MRNHRRATVGALAVTAMIVAACGSDSESADGNITLRVMSVTVVERPEGDVEQAMADAFMAENPDITIEFIGVPMNELYTNLTTMATGGDLPDVFTNSPEFYSRAHQLGIVEPLDELLGEEFIQGFEDVTLDQAYIEGALQFAPFFTIPTGLLYRTDLFDEAGLEPPTTWDDFVDAAVALTTDERAGFALVGSNDGSGGSRFVPIMRSMGAEELTPDGDGWTTALDTPEAVRALQFYGDLVNEYEVTPPGVLQTSYGEAVSLMASEQAAMMVTGPHSIGAIVAQNPELEGKLAGAPIPSDPGHQPASALGMLGFSISAQSEHQEAAAEYIRFILSKENQLAWNEETGRLPSRTEATEDPQVSRDELVGFIEAQQYAFIMPDAPFYPDVQLATSEAYQAVITGTSSAEDAAAAAADQVRRLIDGAQ